MILYISIFKYETANIYYSVSKQAIGTYNAKSCIDNDLTFRRNLGIVYCYMRSQFV